MAGEPVVWEVLVIAFTFFGVIAAITMFVVMYISSCRRSPPKSSHRRQYIVDSNDSGTTPILTPSQSQPFAQGAKTNVSNGKPHLHHHHRRHMVYYLDGSKPFMGLKSIFGRQSSSNHERTFSFDADSLAISPSHPAIFGHGQDIEMSAFEVKCVLTPPTPSKESGPRERRASVIDSEDSA